MTHVHVVTKNSDFRDLLMIKFIMEIIDIAIKYNEYVIRKGL